jgi:DNA invertase Pin-like site-specific DNA recombinase
MLKVTAYGRVSTDSEDQQNSLANQVQYFTEYIRSRPDWKYVPMYVDEGLSGTSTKKRVQFNQMITDAHMGKFDLILTKEVSRFSRNTVDTLQHTRSLKEMGVGVIFTTDNIDSRDSDGELRLSIMAAIAQDESRRTSDRVKWGQKRSMENGVIYGQKTLGYDRNGTGKNATLRINHAEAETVRLIFRKYLDEGKGLTTIAKELEAAHILTGYGKKIWDATAVQRVLTNEKYAGDLVQKKFHTPDYLSHATKRNKDKSSYIVKQNTHPAIIDRDTFNKTQREVERRGVKGKEGSRYTNRFPFSGRLVCGVCGSNLINRNRYVKSVNGKRLVKEWRCNKSFKYGAKQENKGCPSKTVRQEILEQVYLTALDDMVQNKPDLIKETAAVVMGVLNAEQIRSDQADLKQKIERLNDRIKKLINLRLDGEITKDDLQAQREPIDNQIKVLNGQLELLDKNAEQVNEREILLESIKKHISDIVGAEIFDDEAVKETLQKIVIHDKNVLDVYFNGAGEDFRRVCTKDCDPLKHSVSEPCDPVCNYSCNFRRARSPCLRTTLSKATVFAK